MRNGRSGQKQNAFGTGYSSRLKGTEEEEEDTHIAVFVADVVGQLQLVEVGPLGHPVLAGVRRVRVGVESLGHLGIRLACHHPPENVNP